MNRILFGITLFFYFLATFHYVLFLISQRKTISEMILEVHGSDFQVVDPASLPPRLSVTRP